MFGKYADINNFLPEFQFKKIFNVEITQVKEKGQMTLWSQKMHMDNFFFQASN